MTTSTLTKNQKLTFRKQINNRESLTAIIRFDDECGNGHNTFAITGEHYKNGRMESHGCLHDLIARHFPDLAPLIKWHFCSTKGPMHYIANTVFFAEEGSERELDAARQTAIWPDATNDELASRELPDLLQARLPKLLVNFRQAIESLGLIW